MTYTHRFMEPLQLKYFSYKFSEWRHQIIIYAELHHEDALISRVGHA